MPMSPRLLRPITSGDPDARRYIAAVQAADQNTLEPAVRKAITDFIVGCKQDGIWSAIKASCILMGARTLAGALVPLVGAAPTNNNFVSGDYDRETGLKGNGVDKQVDYPFDGSSVPRDDYHLGVYASEAVTVGAIYVAHGRGELGATAIAQGSSSATFTVRMRSTPQNSNVGSMTYPGYVGVSRTNSSNYELRTAGTSSTQTRTSDGDVIAGTTLFNFSTGAALRGNPRIAFFSSGSAINLALLDTRVTALFSAIGAAI